ncbi:hypothetical protein HYR54_00720 [Candidatus Acetothermia bacterium]|nr:hypothetical protein [Candidatus Acetothermia bacterium]MBI3460806.1 hypothetical protein [Candidatus Acetothermia bacterium]
MSKLGMTLVLISLVILIMLTNGCSLFKSSSSHETDRDKSSAPIAAKDSQTIDDLFAEVAKQVPSFGGMFIDSQGNLSVYLLDPTQKVEAESAIASVFGRDRIPSDGIRVLQGEYGFLQLKEWFDRANALLALPGVTLVDIDESKNRLKIGLEKLDALNRVEQALVRINVPREAVNFEETGPIEPKKS